MSFRKMVAVAATLLFSGGAAVAQDASGAEVPLGAPAPKVS